MSTPASPFTDHAAPVLAGEPTINAAQRADLWDAFHTKNADELAQHLLPLAVPEDFKKRLWDAKQTQAAAAVSAVPVAPAEKTAAAIQRMTQLDPKALELAEAHPNVLKAFTSAAAAAEKGAGESAGASKTSGKGNTPAEAKKPAPLAQPPRPDGLAHLPPIPEGHHRILASDGLVHDIPAENIEKARAKDPLLHVLNP